MLVADAFRNADCRQLAVHLTQAREITLDTFLLYEQALNGAGCAQPFLVPKAPELNPPLWELGHVAWFQERWLLRNPERHLGVRCSPDPSLGESILCNADALFDSSTVAHSSRWDLALLNVSKTKEYLQTTLDNSLHELSQLAAKSEKERYLFWLCAAHEYMHAEAFSYMANRLALPTFDNYRQACLAKTQVIYGFSDQSFCQSDFAFDNECLVAQGIDENTPDCDLDEHPVSWADFQIFAQSAEGKAFLNQRDGWVSRAQPLLADNAASPVCQVTYDEAHAWCLSRGRALPTEAQWLAGIQKKQLPWGLVWEWTSSPFTAFPGFTAHPYADYSQPWFGEQFQVLKGGSIITHDSMKHPLYRNFFTPQRNDVFTGFRSCRTAR
jgi:gamma-glutamyl hercynylcysteine S-oxide synthase